MTALGNPSLDLVLLSAINDQLRPADAAELSSYALDDLKMFCTVALAHIRLGSLVVPAAVQEALQHELARAGSESDPADGR